MAGFNDDLTTELVGDEPADYPKVKKLNALWDQELTSVEKHAKFPLKTRWDRSNALFSGRGFMMNYGVNKPEYKNCFEIYELEDAIFQPNGGGHLEHHLYAGRTNVIRSAHALKNGAYNKTQVNKFLANAAKTDDFPLDDEDMKNALAKFKAVGLNAGNDYVGESLFKLAEIGLEADGKRWYMLFSPWYHTWLRFCRLEELNSAEDYPWISWATHEDNKNFL